MPKGWSALEWAVYDVPVRAPRVGLFDDVDLLIPGRSTPMPAEEFERLKSLMAAERGEDPWATR